MKYLLKESQFKGLIEKIKDMENKVSFLKKNLTSMLEKDIIDHLSSRYEGVWNNKNDFVIKPDYIYDKLSIYGNEPRLFVTINMSTNKVEAIVYYLGVHKTSDDPTNVVTWKFAEDENGEELFYLKMNKVIDRKLKPSYQKKLVDSVLPYYEDES